MRDKTDLLQRQHLPLEAKILMSQQRIREWYNYWNGNVYVSFSGGKDSTVLAHLVHELYPEVLLVFSNTGLEYPEIQAFAKKMGAEFVRPKMRFDEVISKYGYPLISKEVAEAIHFARRIVPNIEGGGTTSERKRRELNDLPRSVSISDGGGYSLNGNQQVRTPQNRESQAATHGHRQIGTGGEGKPSPG